MWREDLPGCFCPLKALKRGLLQGTHPGGSATANSCQPSHREPGLQQHSLRGSGSSFLSPLPALTTKATGGGGQGGSSPAS